MAVDLRDRLTQDLRPPRPAARLRPNGQGRPRRRANRSSKARPSPTSSTTRRSSWSASWPSGRQALVVADQAAGRAAPARRPRSSRSTVADLPERVEGWGGLDRLVWQDVDSNQLSAGQLDALRRWLAAGGRLVIVGGSAGIGTLSAFPTTCSPTARPPRSTSTRPASISLLGPLPARRNRRCRRWPAPSAAAGRWRRPAIAVVAAELTLRQRTRDRSSASTRPRSGWPRARASTRFWRAPPARRGATTARYLTDDSQLIQAVYQLPALALPPTRVLLILSAPTS